MSIRKLIIWKLENIQFTQAFEAGLTSRFSIEMLCSYDIVTPFMFHARLKISSE